jgi:GNAT superfamily N-acetyltransferase
MLRSDSRGVRVSGESFERLKTEHCKEFNVLGMLQATPLDLSSIKSSPAAKDRYSGRRWTTLHIDELILNEKLRRQGVGKWLVAKWFFTEYDYAIANDKLKMTARVLDAIDRVPVLRSMIRADETVEPFVTLCVDHENAAARKFYRNLGFVELADSICECPGRVQCLNSADRLKERLGSALETLPPPVESLQRVRIRFTGEELESLLFQILPRTQSCYDFGIDEFELALKTNDPAATIAKTIADFYYEEFSELIRENVIFKGAALMPVGVKAGTERPKTRPETFDDASEAPLESDAFKLEDEFIVKKGIVYLFTLDRLLMWKTPRVLLTHSEFQDKKLANKAPERTDPKQWEDTKFLVLFGRSTPATK